MECHALDDIVVSPNVVEYGTVNSPLCFDELSGFVSRSDDVLTLSSMDLSFFFSIFLPFVIMSLCRVI